jgi:hypothetical protein
MRLDRIFPMNSRLDHYRREAMQLEDVARRISFLPDKEELLAEARRLRRRADELARAPDAVLSRGGAC